MESEFEQNMKFSRSEQIVSSKVDQDMFLMSVEKGAYFRMDPVGTRIWELLEQPLGRDEIVEKLMQEYAVEEKTCAEETDHFLGRLLKANLLKEVEAEV